MQLSQLLLEESINLSLVGKTREEVLQGIVSHIISIRPELSRSESVIYKKLLEREMLEPTALDNGAAIPHCRVKEVKEPIVTLSKTVEPVNFGARQGKPTKLFLTVLSPVEQPALHLRVLAAVAQFLKDGQNVKKVLQAQTVAEILDWIRQRDLKS